MQYDLHVLAWKWERSRKAKIAALAKLNPPRSIAFRRQSHRVATSGC